MDLSKLKAGDDVAWDEATGELLPFATTVVRWMAPSLTQEEKTEVAEDALLELISKIDKIYSEEKLRPWLFKCAKRRALDKLRKRGRMKNFLSRADTLSAEEDDGEDTGVEDENEKSPDEATQQAELCELAAGILGALDPETTELLRLYFLLGWSQAEIGKHYGWETESVGNRINQALNRARKLLSSDERFKGIDTSDL